MRLKTLLENMINKIKSVDEKHTPVLLWENASPTSSFAEQTISVDLSDYDYFRIDIYKGPSYYFRKGAGYMTIEDSGNFVGTPYWHQDMIRKASNISINSIKFFNMINVEIYATNIAGSIMNSILVPYKIYGLKY